MLDIAYLAVMAACLALCVGLIDWLARSEDPASATESER